MSDREVLFLLYCLGRRAKRTFPLCQTSPRVLFCRRLSKNTEYEITFVISEESVEDSERFAGAGAEAVRDVHGHEQKPVPNSAPAKSIRKKIQKPVSFIYISIHWTFIKLNQVKSPKKRHSTQLLFCDYDHNLAFKVNSRITTRWSLEIIKKRKYLKTPKIQVPTKYVQVWIKKPSILQTYSLCNT